MAGEPEQRLDQAAGADDESVESAVLFSSADSDRLFFRLIMLLFMGVFLYVLEDGLSPFLVGSTLLVLVLLVRRGIRFEAGVATVVILLFGAWFVSNVAGLLWPFVISFVLAYLLAPLVGVVERWISRTLAIGLIVLLVLGTLFGIGMVVIPRIIDEVREFGSRLPSYGLVIKGFFENLLALGQSYGIDISFGEIRQWFVDRLPEVGKLFADQTTSALKGLSSGLAALLNLLMIPFVTFYVLKDFERIKQGLRGFLPRRHVDSTVALLDRIDNVLGQYVRGQVLVCSFIAALTALGLALSGIRYSVLLGIMAGISNLIPYVGLAVSLGVTALVALLDANALVNLIKVGAVFAIVQFVEGNFLSPRVVGERVGLHPVWVMFALVVAAHFWGFVGMVIAIPVAAVVNVVANLTAERYYSSRYYG